jgi:hypothetical protein
MGLTIISGSWRFFLWGEEVGMVRECRLEEIIDDGKLVGHSSVVVLLPREKGERENDMVALLNEETFRDLVSNLRMKKSEDSETRGELIKAIESYVKYIEKIGTECDLFERAKVEGILLESVLRLLAQDHLDPLGCIILAQQDREIQVDKVSPVFEVDVE